MEAATLSATPHRRWWKIARWGVPVAVVAGAAVGVARWQAAHPKPTVKYETSAVDRGPIAAKVTATGAVSALTTVLVGSQVSGRIESIFVDYQSPVKKGQTIATIEPSFFRAAVAQATANQASAAVSIERARAQRLQAERAQARAKSLYADGLVSRADWESAEAALGFAIADGAAAASAYRQTTAALEQANLNLKYTTIVSPTDGVVISRNIDVGQTVAAALQAPTLFTIAQDLTRMQVDTNVAEADVGKVHTGMPVTFTVDAYPLRTFPGKVRQVRDNAQTIQNVVTYDAVVDVDNPERLLKPGMTASVTFVYATRADALRIPNGALRYRADSTTKPPTIRANERMVWIVRNDAPVSLIVEIGVSDGAFTEVLGGDVHPGDRAVVEANHVTP